MDGWMDGWMAFVLLLARRITVAGAHRTCEAHIQLPLGLGLGARPAARATR